MKYWQVLKDVSGSGTMNDPNDNMANYVWDHLFIYKDLEGTIPKNSEPFKRLHIGEEIPVNIDSGPSGKPLSGGAMDYAKERGGSIVFTDSMIPEIKNIALKLTSPYLYSSSVVLIHFMREGDQKMAVSDLMKKYPRRKAREIVLKGWL